MIEQQLNDDFEDDEIDEFAEEQPPAEIEVQLSDVPAPPSLDLGATVFDTAVDVEEMEPDISLDIDGELNLDIESQDVEEEEEDEELLLSKSGLEMLESYIHSSRNKKLSSRVNILNKRVKTLSKTVNAVDFRKLSLSEKKIALTYYGKLLNELFSLSQSVIIMSESVDERLEYRILGMLKEIKDMSRKKDRTAFRRLFEELAQDEGLREQDDEIAVEDEEIDVEEEVPADGDVDVDAATGALEDLGAALGLDVAVAPEGELDVEVEDEEGAEGGEIDLELEEGGVDEIYEIF